MPFVLGCVSDLDAHGFCRGYNNPLVMMGATLDRCLPGFQRHACNEAYVINQLLYQTNFVMPHAKAIIATKMATAKNINIISQVKRSFPQNLVLY